MPTTLPARAEHRPVAVVGGGALGRRIALVFASCGGHVRVYEVDAAAGRAAVEFVDAELPALVTRRPGARAGTVEATDDLATALHEAWLVVEAVPEHLELKRSVLAEVDRRAAPDAIIATNSSSFPSSRLIDDVLRPERVLNMHFFRPPEQAAVELMSDGHTDRAVIDLLLGALPAFGLRPFEARQESVGFVFNRIWAAVKREALTVVAEGVSTPAEVDELFRLTVGSPVGVFQAMDQVGLDVVLDIEEHYVAEDPSRSQAPLDLLRRYVDAGHLGVKTGSGFHDHGTGAPTAH